MRYRATSATCFEALGLRPGSTSSSVGIWVRVQVWSATAMVAMPSRPVVVVVLVVASWVPPS